MVRTLTARSVPPTWFASYDPLVGNKKDSPNSAEDDKPTDTPKSSEANSDEAALPKAELSDASQREIAAAAPPAAVDALTAEVTYPDDGWLSGFLRKANHYLGLAEQGVLFAILIAVVGSACYAAIGAKLKVEKLEWTSEIVRNGVFAIAMIGAAFASQQERHLAMDLLSKRLTPRGRLILRVLLALFTIAVVAVLLRSGWNFRDKLADEGGDHMISSKNVWTLIPFAALLIIIHSLLYMLIDLDYLFRGKLPPEKLKLSH